MKINAKCNTIKEKLNVGKSAEVLINIKYPSFKAEGEDKSRLCDKMNSFYEDIAKKYFRNAKERIPNRLAKISANESVNASALMKYTVSVCDEKIICVVVDFYFYFGEKLKTRRFSQTWNTESGCILPTGKIFKTNKDGRKKIYSFVLTLAHKNHSDSSFGYYDDYEKRLRKAFDTESFFISPRGICFFVNAGIISPAKHGACCFVLPYESVKDIISKDFLPKENEKTFEDSDIVNNV